MTKIRIALWPAFCGILISMLAACGGGSSSGPTGGGDIIDRSGRSVGTIKGFGSVIVNGVSYDLTSAIITVDDQPGQESDLAVGQVVSIEGLVNADGETGEADRVTTDPALRGDIESIDPDLSFLVVLNTRVNIVSSTVFDSSINPAALTTLSIGDTIEVYGFAGSDGAITATLITRSTDIEKEARGFVSNLDDNARTFTLTSLSVDYSGAVLEGFSNSIANGDYVEVEGELLNGSTLQADRVELEDTTSFSSEDENTEVEIEGLVTRFVSATDFDVNGVVVTTNNTTTYEGGSAADIALNVRIEVEGRIDSSGVLVADEVEFEPINNVEILARVEAVDADAGTVTLLGIELLVDSGTALIDESDADLQFFSLQDVAVDDFVKAKAFASGNTVQLTLFKRINPEDTLKLEGPVSSIADPSLFINGAQLNTDGATSFEIGETSSTASEFFTAIQVGDQVSAEGQSPSAGVLLAEKIELE